MERGLISRKLAHYRKLGAFLLAYGRQRPLLFRCWSADMVLSGTGG